MDFGKLENIDGVDFTLPADHPDTVKALGGNKEKTKPDIYVGGAKWGRKDWIGKIYPKGTKADAMLGEYVGYFNSIELNATHYQFHKPEQIKKWVDMTDPAFRFCPKFPQIISHRFRLRNSERITGDFLDLMRLFGQNLGTLFLQMPANFHPDKLENLIAFLNLIPDDISMALELRDSAWYDENGVTGRLFEVMRQRRVGTVITDTAGRRDLIHMHLTTPEAFIRFVGNNLHPTDFQRIDEWIDRIEEWINLGLQKIWFFIHQIDERFTPELADYTVKRFNKKLGANLRWPGLIDNNDGQTSLL